jgi:ElaB/YqjD/DUF883 family membrane-anchored ribosome-binding protein
MTQGTDEAGRQEGLAGQASAKMQDAASTAQEKASELKEQGSARLRDQFDQRSNEAGSQLRSVAEALRRSGSDLGDDGNNTAAQLTGQAADRIERFGGYLEQKRGDDLINDIESFARRRPWMLAGLGFLVGVAVARFVKASSEQRYDEWRGTNGPRQNRPGLPYGPATGTYRHTEPASVPSTLGDDPLARDPAAGMR